MVFKFEIDADLLNLYLSVDYINATDGIKISPLPVAKEFEKERKRIGSKFCRQRVKTAKVIFSINLEDNNPSVAIKNFEETISNYEFLLSFINRRDIATTGEYVCYLVNETGRQVVGRGFNASKLFFNILNNKSVMVSGIHTGPVTCTSDISPFLDLIFQKFRALENDQLFNQKLVKIAMNLYLLALEDNYEEIKFVQVWNALEALSNKLYKTNPLPPEVRYLLTHEEKILFISKVTELIEDLWDDLEHSDERVGKGKLKKRLQQPYIYEIDSVDKIKNMLGFLEISEDQPKINETLNEARTHRNNIMHGTWTDINLNDLSLVRLKLQLFLEKAILAILGVNKVNEKLYMTNFYNRQ